MTIPKMPLTVKALDWDNLTLVQYAVLAGRTDDIMDIREFLLQNTTWRRQEINQIALKDLAQVVEMITAAIERQVSPNEPSPSSSPGQEAAQT